MDRSAINAGRQQTGDVARRPVTFVFAFPVVASLVSLGSVMNILPRTNVSLQPEVAPLPKHVVAGFSGNSVDGNTIKLSPRERDLSQEPLIRSKNETRNADLSWLGEEWKDEDCAPMAKWQLKKYSPYACNAIHEIDIDPVSSGLRLIHCGGTRCAYQVRDAQGHAAVFKSQK